MAKFRVLSDKELYRGLLEERDDKVAQLHREIQGLIQGNNENLEQDSKLLMQAANCSPLKMSQLSMNSSLSKLLASRNESVTKQNDRSALRRNDKNG